MNYMAGVDNNSFLSCLVFFTILPLPDTEFFCLLQINLGLSKGRATHIVSPPQRIGKSQAKNPSVGRFAFQPGIIRSPVLQEAELGSRVTDLFYILFAVSYSLQWYSNGSMINRSSFTVEFHCKMLS